MAYNVFFMALLYNIVGKSVLYQPENHSRNARILPFWVLTEQKSWVFRAKTAFFEICCQICFLILFFLPFYCFKGKNCVGSPFLYTKSVGFFRFFLLEKTCEFLLFNGKIYPLDRGQDCHENFGKYKQF